MTSSMQSTTPNKYAQKGVTTTIDKMRGCSASNKLQAAMTMLDKGEVTALSPEDLKALAHAATKSAEMKAFVEAWNIYEAAMLWPAALKQSCGGLHHGIVAKVDVQEAGVRDLQIAAEPGARDLLAHMTCVQALLAGPDKDRAAKCAVALERAKGWGVAVKPAVSRALATYAPPA